MNALVTGGGGFLGMAIVRRLLERGARVSTLSRLAHPALGDLRVEQILGDVADAGVVARAVEGRDVVFHTAAKAGVWGAFEDYHRTNFIGTQNVVAACRRHGVPRLVYTSSPSVVFDGKDMENVDESAPYPARFEAHYPRTKAMAEQWVRQAADGRLATVSLRPHLIWGPGDNHLLPRLASRARAGQLRRIGPGGKLIDTIYIDNAAEAHLLAAERLAPGSALSGKVYFISQGEPVETWEMINRLLGTAGAPAVERAIPARAALMLAGCFELWHRLSRNAREPRLTRFVVKELCAAHWFNITAARRDLGYEPRVSITEGLARTKAAGRGAA